MLEIHMHCTIIINEGNNAVTVCPNIFGPHCMHDRLII